MKFIISENKFTPTFEKFLKSEGLDNVMPHGNGITGCYYPIDWYDMDDEGDYEPAPCVFVYYLDRNEYLEYHNLPETFDDYSDSDFPLVELDYEIYNRLSLVFTEDVILKYLPSFFEKIIGNKVNRVVAG
jgi:hypothetical protein